MKGSIIVRKRKDGSVAYLPKFDSGRDPKTNKRLQSYGQTHSTKKAALQELRDLWCPSTKACTSHLRS